MWKLIKEDFSIVYQKDPAINSKIELFFKTTSYLSFITCYFSILKIKNKIKGISKNHI